MIATSGFLSDLEYTKYVFDGGSAPDPGAYSAPTEPLAGLREGPTTNGKGVKRKEEVEKWRGGKRKGGVGDRREGEGEMKVKTPPSSILAYSPVNRTSLTL